MWLLHDNAHLHLKIETNIKKKTGMVCCFYDSNDYTVAS